MLLRPILCISMKTEVFIFVEPCIIFLIQFSSMFHHQKHMYFIIKRNQVFTQMFTHVIFTKASYCYYNILPANCYFTLLIYQPTWFCCLPFLLAEIIGILFPCFDFTRLFFLSQICQRTTPPPFFIS